LNCELQAQIIGFAVLLFFARDKLVTAVDFVQ